MLKYSVETGKVSSACLCKIDVILCTRNNFHGQKLGNLSQASHNKTKKYFKAICQRLFEVKITFDSNCDTAETESSTCNICIKIFEINLKYRKKSQCVWEERVVQKCTNHCLSYSLLTTLVKFLFFNHYKKK